MNILLKLSVFLKRRKKSLIFLLLLATGVSVWFFKFSGDDIKNDFAVAKIGSVVQEVSVTGRVKSAQSIDLAFEKGGKVAYVGVKSGDKVLAGRILIRLDDSELLAQEQREMANVSATESRLNQISSLANNISGDASAVADSLSKALKSSIDIMIDFTDVQYKYFNNNTVSALKLAEQKNKVLNLIYGGQGDFGRLESWYFTALNSGLKLEVDQFQNDPNKTSSDSLILSVREVLLAIKSALESMQAELAAQHGVSQADIDKVNNNIDITLAQIAEVSSRRKNIVGEGYDIEIARSQLEQAKASLALVRVQISKYRLVAPFSGVVANVDIKAGQIVSPNEVMVSMIGRTKFQIETNISEADIAKISVGDGAKVTLDAYGDESVFTAKVIHLDPAGRVIDGITVYKVTLEFDLGDERILSGLTADIDILTDKKSDVMYIPSRNVIYRDGGKYVKVFVDKDFNDSRFANLISVSEKDDQNIFEVEIETGLKGSDGGVEVISGLREGDQLIRE
ncbi:MAG: efflux RND transporter periplasmic adaptor subunit [bacterium]|nr:efflux RND transporter periplasmic adaptor subunit [bacterium]